MSTSSVSDSTAEVARTGRPVVAYSPPLSRASWELPEGKVAEAPDHVRRVDFLHGPIARRLELLGRSVGVYRNLAIRWDPDHPGRGFDPDVCVIEPPLPSDPAGVADSLRRWREGHGVVLMALEVVSRNHPYKDYGETPDKSAAAGVAELVVFDPLLAGPRAGGGPHLLQLWRVEGASFSRVSAGKDAVFSEVLGAWLVVAGDVLRVADDRGGERLWPTAAEERDRATEERDRLAAERDALARRVAELERRDGRD